MDFLSPVNLAASSIVRSSVSEVVDVAGNCITSSNGCNASQSAFTFSGANVIVENVRRYLSYEADKTCKCYSVPMCESA